MLIVHLSMFRKSTLRKHHKWFGLIVAFFLLACCVSGIVLNHRRAVASVNISRSWLPSAYHYTHWNNGLLRGTLAFSDSEKHRKVLLYGASGMWLTDSVGSDFANFNQGLPKGADYLQVRAAVQMPSQELFALTPYALYRRLPGQTSWREQHLPGLETNEWLTDLTLRGDTLVVLSRSSIFLSVPPYHQFFAVVPQAAEGQQNRVSWFRLVWTLHNGELFGLPGQLLVDVVGVILVLLVFTGVWFWLLPYLRKALGKRFRVGKMMGDTLRWHNRLGRYTLLFTLFVAVTGWCLRPPILIFLATHTLPAPPGTTLHSDNPWHDQLRLIRYDSVKAEWLLSTSRGFYALKHLRARPQHLTNTPPVSVMGLNVWEMNAKGEWICGSFSGMFVWNRATELITDAFTGRVASLKPGPPFGAVPVSGYSTHFKGQPITVTFQKGTSALAQPSRMRYLPMSLWNVMLEVHTGRIFMGNLATYLFIFVLGLAVIWCLWTGWKLLKKN